MNLTSMSVGVELRREESRRRLEDLIRPAQLGVLRFSRLISADSSLVTPGRWPASTSAWRTRLRSVSAVRMPSFSATAQVAGQSDGYFGRTWAAIRTARSRSSRG
jgi:hypothetical protein